MRIVDVGLQGGFERTHLLDGQVVQELALAGMQVNIPRLFAALSLIDAAGIALFTATVWLSRAALSRWHESETRAPG